MKKLLAVIGVIFLLPIIVIGSVIGGLVLLTSGTSESASASTFCASTPGELPAAVPQPLNSIISQAAAHWGTDPYAVAVVYHNENGWTFDREPPPPYGRGPAWRTSFAGAGGPFQFMPLTWLAYRNSNPSNQPGDINDLTDAAYAAAHYLSVLGAKQGTPLGSPDTVTQKPTLLNAIVSYHSGNANDLGPFGRQYMLNGYRAYQELSATGALSSGDASSTPQSVSLTESLCTSLPPLEDVKGYPNTDNVQCAAGTDAGIQATAKGNRLRLCSVRGAIVNAPYSAYYDAWMAKIEATYPELEIKAGSSFRKPEDQIRVRRNNCGSSHYDIYEKPSGQCSPRTAIPGTSQHEQAAAFDFTSKGRLITSYSSAAHRALAATAEEFGFKPLVTGDEAWHFSRTGG